MIVIGISCRLASDGKMYPYLVVVDGGKEVLQSTVALPSDKKYLKPPVHPEYGDLLKGPDKKEVMEAIEWRFKGQKILTHKDNEGLEILQNIDVGFEDILIESDEEEAFSQIEVIRKKHECNEGV